MVVLEIKNMSTTYRYLLVSVLCFVVVSTSFSAQSPMQAIVAAVVGMTKSLSNVRNDVEDPDWTPTVEERADMSDLSITMTKLVAIHKNKVLPALDGYLKAERGDRSRVSYTWSNVTDAIGEANVELVNFQSQLAESGSSGDSDFRFSKTRKEMLINAVGRGGGLAKIVEVPWSDELGDTPSKQDLKDLDQLRKEYGRLVDTLDDLNDAFNKKLLSVKRGP